MQRLPSMIKHSISETVFKWVIIVAHPQENVIEFLSMERGFLPAKLKSHQHTFPCSGFSKTLPIPDQLCLVVCENWQLCLQMAHLQPRKLFWESYPLFVRKENGATTTTCRWLFFLTMTPKFWTQPFSKAFGDALSGTSSHMTGTERCLQRPKTWTCALSDTFPPVRSKGNFSKCWENKLPYKVKHRHHRKQDQSMTAVKMHSESFQHDR